MLDVRVRLRQRSRRGCHIAVADGNAPEQQPHGRMGAATQLEKLVMLIVGGETTICAI